MEKKKAKKQAKREVWRVVIGSLKPSLFSDKHTYYVFAESAAVAEKRGIAIAKAEDGVTRPYCQSAAFSHYVR